MILLAWGCAGRFGRVGALTSRATIILFLSLLGSGSPFLPSFFALFPDVWLLRPKFAPIPYYEFVVFVRLYISWVFIHRMVFRVHISKL